MARRQKVEKQVKIEDNLVQKLEKENDFLLRPLFNVNMRLFRSNKHYHMIIIKICNYMKLVINQKYENYPKLAGLSGANIGIPFNIITILRKDDLIDFLHMINPTIIEISSETRKLQTNCGSLNLPSKYPVVRREWIEVSYYDVNGNHNQEKFTLDNGGSTIQHEIDHNKGILITDNHKHL